MRPSSPLTGGVAAGDGPLADTDFDQHSTTQEHGARRYRKARGSRKPSAARSSEGGPAPGSMARGRRPRDARGSTAWPRAHYDDFRGRGRVAAARTPPWVPQRRRARGRRRRGFSAGAAGSRTACAPSPTEGGRRGASSAAKDGALAIMPTAPAERRTASRRRARAAKRVGAGGEVVVVEAEVRGRGSSRPSRAPRRMRASRRRRLRSARTSEAEAADVKNARERESECEPVVR